MGNVPRGKLSSKAKIIKSPPAVCTYRKTMVKILAEVPLAHQVAVHRSCLHNEYAALYNRHLIDRCTENYDVSYIKAVTKKLVSRITFDLMLESVHPREVINRYTGPKRAAYKLGFEQLKRGFNRNMANVNMFVKPDKYSVGEIYDKAPRAIQFRCPAFNLALASYLLPFEHWFYNEYKSLAGTRVSAKGLNQQERAELLAEKAARFDRPAFMLMDHSKFDSCVTVEHYKLILHKIYNKCFNNKFLAYLLSLQLNNRGRTLNGIMYRVRGTKMSGDFNTALDNTLLNYIVLESYFRLENVVVELLIDGDDSVAVVEQENVDRMLARFDHFGKFGFTTKLEVVTDIRQVEFCRSVYLPGVNPNFARDPYRACSNLSIGLKGYRGAAKYKYLAGNALGEMHRSNGIPVIFALAKALYEFFGTRGVILDTQTAWKLEQYRCKEFTEPTMEWREAFSLAYGISIDRQEQLESEARELYCCGKFGLKYYSSAAHSIKLRSWRNSLFKFKEQLISRNAA